MRIAIFGVGAMGSLFAAGLSAAAPVTMIGEWEAQVRAVRDHGLAVRQVDGSTTLHHPSAMLRDDARGPFDVALVLEKSHQTAATAPTVSRLLNPDGLAVTLQNGLGNLEALQAATGPGRSSLGITSEGATLVELGFVRHAGHGYTNFGIHPALSDHQQALLAELSERFISAGFPAALVDSPERLLWEKLCVNAAINPLTALLRVPNGVLLQHPALLRVMDAAAREVASVAAAQGIQVEPNPAARARTVARMTAANRSSMLQDIQRGAPTEIEAICGEVVARGKRLGVPTPVNRRLAELVRLAEGRGPLLIEGDVGGLIDLLGEPLSS